MMQRSKKLTIPAIIVMLTLTMTYVISVNTFAITVSPESLVPDTVTVPVEFDVVTYLDDNSTHTENVVNKVIAYWSSYWITSSTCSETTTLWDYLVSHRRMHYIIQYSSDFYT